MDKAQALYTFWSSFGLLAYDQYTVPDSANMPYITYETQTGSFDDTPKQLTASLWYRSSSWAGIEAMKEAIYTHIGRGGVQIPYTNGTIWIKRGDNFAQRMNDDTDDMIRR